jgi:hypothetical protein
VFQVELAEGLEYSRHPEHVVLPETRASKEEKRFTLTFTQLFRNQSLENAYQDVNFFFSVHKLCDKLKHHSSFQLCKSLRVGLKTCKYCVFVVDTMNTNYNLHNSSMKLSQGTILNS